MTTSDARIFTFDRPQPVFVVPTRVPEPEPVRQCHQCLIAITDGVDSDLCPAHRPVDVPRLQRRVELLEAEVGRLTSLIESKKDT